MSNTAHEIYDLPPGAEREFAVSFAGQLDPADTITGTPTVDGDDLMVSGVRINPSAILFRPKPLLTPALQSVLFMASGAVSGLDYTLTVTATTTSGQTLVGYVRVQGSAA